MGYINRSNRVVLNSGDLGDDFVCTDLVYTVLGVYGIGFVVSTDGGGSWSVCNLLSGDLGWSLRNSGHSWSTRQALGYTSGSTNLGDSYNFSRACNSSSC